MNTLPLVYQFTPTYTWVGNEIGEYRKPLYRYDVPAVIATSVASTRGVELASVVSLPDQDPLYANVFERANELPPNAVQPTASDSKLTFELSTAVDAMILIGLAGKIVPTSGLPLFSGL
jgi:hypothetical protein